MENPKPENVIDVVAEEPAAETAPETEAAAAEEAPPVDPIAALEERCDLNAQGLADLHTYVTGLVANITFLTGEVQKVQQAITLLTSLQPGAPAAPQPGRVVVAPVQSIPRGAPAAARPAGARPTGPRPMRPLQAAPNAPGRGPVRPGGPRALPPLRPAPNAPGSGGRPRVVTRQVQAHELAQAVDEAGGVISAEELAIDVTGLPPGEYVYPGAGPGGADLVVNVRRPGAPANGAPAVGRVQR